MKTKRTIDNSLEGIARVLGCSIAQASAGLMRNAKAMRDYTDKDLKQMGKTRSEMNAIADDYERRAKCVS